jgi:hypothetical protein
MGLKRRASTVSARFKKLVGRLSRSIDSDESALSSSDSVETVGYSVRKLVSRLRASWDGTGDDDSQDCVKRQASESFHPYADPAFAPRVGNYRRISATAG